MQAYQLRDGFGIDKLRIVELPDPAPGPGQVRMRLRAWSLNFRDLMMVKGLYNPKLKLPMVPLSDGVGIVEAVGAGVDRVAVGDRVCAAFMPDWISGRLTDAKGRTALGGGGVGMLAEAVVLGADAVVKVPQHLTDEEAATLPCAAVTAWNALFVQAKVGAGDTVLVQGTGGVSLFALQLARLAGARVIATSGSDAKAERVKGLGASDVINYRTTPEWGQRARELTAGEGVDHVVEVGGAGTIAQSLKAIRSGGVVSVIGVLSGVEGTFDPRPILMRQVRLQGIYVGSREMFEDMNRAIALHGLRPVVGETHGFRDVPAALQAMEKASHFGKIVIRAS